MHVDCFVACLLMDSKISVRDVRNKTSWCQCGTSRLLAFIISMSRLVSKIGKNRRCDNCIFHYILCYVETTAVCLYRVVVHVKLSYLKQTGRFLDGRNNEFLLWNCVRDCSENPFRFSLKWKITSLYFLFSSVFSEFYL
jgi:hypothetical protein